MESAKLTDESKQKFLSSWFSLEIHRAQNAAKEGKNSSLEEYCQQQQGINAVRYEQQWKLNFLGIKAIAFMVIYKVNMSQSVSLCLARVTNVDESAKNHQAMLLF